MIATRLALAAACALTGSATVLAQTPSLPGIRWEPFELPKGISGVTAQLGRLAVPQVRREPGSRSIDLAFVRVQAEKRGKAAPIVFLAGGPGQSGVSVARSSDELRAIAKLAQVGDVILLDQRGVALSTPNPICRAPALPPADSRTSAARAVDNVRACVAEMAAKGVDARAFTNRESAADVDDIRRALGVPKVSVYGFSYGTYLGLSVLRDFGANVERAALVGTAGVDEMRKLPWTSDVQLAKLSLLAARDPAIGREVPDMMALATRVFARLDSAPMRVRITDATRQEVERVVTGDMLRNIILADIGDGNDFTVFPALFLTIDRGDDSILAWFVEKRYGAAASGATNLMYLGMRCSAGSTRARDAEIAMQAPTSLFKDIVNSSYAHALCAALPDMDPGDDYRKPLLTDVPVLFISGTMDNNTPPFQAERLRWGMPRATHLVVENAGHEDTLPMDGVQAAIVDFFAGKDVADRRLALPTPKFPTVEQAKRDRRRQSR